jgi:hypothetical protein
MKKVFAFVLMSAAIVANAQSKFDTCFEASQVAQAAYLAKTNKDKVKFVFTGDLVQGLVLKQAFDLGYKKAKSEKEAAKLAFEACSKSNFWE